MNLRNILFAMLAIGFIACNSSKKKTTDESCCQKNTSSVQSMVNYPEWSYDATIYEVNIRQYTPEGTFVAFEKHLPRLQELGVEILWMMPIHPVSKVNRKGSLGSYYSVADYKAINPEFGTFEEFKLFVQKAHEMGFKVILDWVANHTGWDNQWIAQNPEWYTTDTSGKIITPNPDWTDVADLNYDNIEMRAAMIDALKFWVVEADIDGYRCDVADDVPTDFWEGARASLDSIKPVWMLAEAEDTKELLLKSFNADYGWSFHHIMNNIAKGKATAMEVRNYLAQTDSVYPLGSYPMQFTSNHDENSWSGSEYERMGDATQTFAALTFVMPGIPLIYSGQEASLNKKLRFFDKDTIDWVNLKMESFYSKLIQLKKSNKALWNGNAGAPVHVLHTAENNTIIAFSRFLEEHKVIVIMNLSPEKAENKVTCEKFSGTFTNFATGEKVTLKPGQDITLEGWEYKIFSKE